MQIAALARAEHQPVRPQVDRPPISISGTMVDSQGNQCGSSLTLSQGLRTGVRMEVTANAPFRQARERTATQIDSADFWVCQTPTPFDFAYSRHENRSREEHKRRSALISRIFAPICSTTIGGIGTAERPDPVETKARSSYDDAGMRRASTKIGRYLGRMAGAGSVRVDGETVARANYEFDGFAAPPGGAIASGEIMLPSSDLESVFGRVGVQLLTDDGRLLDLTFSEKALPPATDTAHVDVRGDLPRSPAEWRAGSK